MPLKVAGRLPVIFGFAVGLGALAASGLRSGYVLGSKAVIERRSRPLAYWSLIAVVIILASIFCFSTAAVLWMTYGPHSAG
jgi:hypothetical protein